MTVFSRGLCWAEAHSVGGRAAGTLPPSAGFYNQKAHPQKLLVGSFPVPHSLDGGKMQKQPHGYGNQVQSSPRRGMAGLRDERQGMRCERQQESLGELEMVCPVVGWMGLEVGECCRRVALRSGRRHPPAERWLLQLQGRPLREAPRRLLPGPPRPRPLFPCAAPSLRAAVQHVT
eukprot:3938827-Rhodomonas_salina.2